MLVSIRFHESYYYNSSWTMRTVVSLLQLISMEPSTLQSRVPSPSTVPIKAPSPGEVKSGSVKSTKGTRSQPSRFPHTVPLPFYWWFSTCCCCCSPPRSQAYEYSPWLVVLNKYANYLPSLIDLMTLLFLLEGRSSVWTLSSSVIKGEICTSSAPDIRFLGATLCQCRKPKTCWCWKPKTPKMCTWPHRL